MPRYAYHCGACDKTLVVQHLSDEVITDCAECDATGTLTKLVTSFRTALPARSQKGKVGTITEEFIEDARKDLAKQKEDLEEKSK
tara:strand:+ start:843 stop:1097 length:255 start_codon:yes stop_codon:yes gene_type:complete